MQDLETYLYQISSVKIFVDPKCHPACFHSSTLISVATIVRVAFMSLSAALSKYLAKAKDSAMQHTIHFLSILSQQSLTATVNKDST